MCRALHVFMSCDSISAKCVRTRYQEILELVENDWSLSQDLLSRLVSFVSAISGDKNGIKNVNRLWLGIGWEIEGMFNKCNRCLLRLRPETFQDSLQLDRGKISLLTFAISMERSD